MRTFFHFVRQAKGYYYDADAIKADPRKARVVNGAVVSATGVSGVRYKRQLELSTALNETEKQAAFAALEAVLDQVRRGELDDFRMVIRGQQRTTHSDSAKVLRQSEGVAAARLFTFSSTTRKEPSRATYGRYCPKTRSSEQDTTLPIPTNCA